MNLKKVNEYIKQFDKAIEEPNLSFEKMNIMLEWI